MSPDSPDERPEFIPPAEPPMAPPEMPSAPMPPPPPPGPGAGSPPAPPGPPAPPAPPAPPFGGFASSGPPPPPPPVAPPLGSGRRVPGFAIASLVLGIFSVVLLCFCGIGVVVGIPAIVFGLLARNQIVKNPEQYSGAGLWIAGVACGGVAVVLGGGYWLFVLFSSLTS